MLSVVSSTRTIWQDLGFVELQKLLETTVLELAANREKSETKRAALVKHTREFLKAATEETRNNVMDLLRHFQSEVDDSRKRSSYAEDAYIALYKKLVDLPDPCLALTEAENLQKKASELTEVKCENRRLKESMEQLKSELSNLKHHKSESIRLQKQLNDTVRNFDTQVKETSSQLMETHNRLLHDKEQELLAAKAELDEKSRIFEEKSMNLSKALNIAQSELFRLRMLADKSEIGKSSELEMLMEDLEKANARIKDLETRMAFNESHDSPSTMPSGQVSLMQSRLDDLVAELSNKDNEIASLISTVNSLREEKQTLQQSLQLQIEKLVDDLSVKEKILSNLQSQLDAQSNYSEVCRELALLRSIEFPEDADVVTRSDPDGEVNSVSTTESKCVQQCGSLEHPLEELLLNKNRALQNEIAQLRAANEQLQADLSRLQMFEVEAKQHSKEQTEVIALLESDLYRLQGMCDELQRTATLTIPTHADPADSPGSVRSMGLEGRILAEAIGDDSVNTVITSRIDPALLQIVEHQRDRFRARADELEQTEANLRQQLLVVQREVENVRMDNVKLYEKIRFLQTYSYPVRSQVSAAAAASPSKQSEMVALHLTLDPSVKKYSEAYEAQLNPFNQFSRTERERHYGELRPHEKVMLKVFRLVSSDRRFRLGAFVYAVVLHLLVFIALYKAAMSQKSANEADANCLQRYAEHMLAVHKEVVPRNRV